MYAFEKFKQASKSEDKTIIRDFLVALNNGETGVTAPERVRTLIHSINAANIQAKVALNNGETGVTAPERVRTLIHSINAANIRAKDALNNGETGVTGGSGGSGGYVPDLINNGETGVGQQHSNRLRGSRLKKSPGIIGSR